jgi:hypothetical protein
VGTNAADQIDFNASVFKLLAILWTNYDCSFYGFTIFVQRRFLLSVLAASLELDHITSILAIEPDFDVTHWFEEASHAGNGINVPPVTLLVAVPLNTEIEFKVGCA